jgi:hypothetical protein
MEARVSQSIQQRLDHVIDHINDIGARATQIVLTESDYEELQRAGAALDTKGAYRNLPVRKGQIGGSSYVDSEHAPSGNTSFAI